MTSTMQPKQAEEILEKQFTPEGTYQYMQLISVIADELGIVLAYAIDQKQTAKVRALQGVLSDENVLEAYRILFTALGISETLDTMQSDIHKAIAKAFKAHQSLITPRPFLLSQVRN